MKLKNSLYTIVAVTADAGVSQPRFSLLLNAGHPIYKAHFPGWSVTPGACIVQIALELLEEAVGKELEIAEVRDVKFLAVISPDETSQIDYVFNKIHEEECSAQAVVASGDKQYAKLSFSCRAK